MALAMRSPTDGSEPCLGRMTSATRPSGLVARPEPGPIVTVDVLEEQHAVTPPGLRLQSIDRAEARSAAARVEQEDVDQTLPKVGGHDVERRERP
jgi:hypothetical protein